MRGCIEPKRNFDPNFTIVEKKKNSPSASILWNEKKAQEASDLLT